MRLREAAMRHLYFSMAAAARAGEGRLANLSALGAKGSPPVEDGQ